MAPSPRKQATKPSTRIIPSFHCLSRQGFPPKTFRMKCRRYPISPLVLNQAQQAHAPRRHCTRQKSYVSLWYAQGRPGASFESSADIFKKGDVKDIANREVFQVLAAIVRKLAAGGGPPFGARCNRLFSNLHRRPHLRRTSPPALQTPRPSQGDRARLQTAHIRVTTIARLEANIRRRSSRRSRRISGRKSPAEAEQVRGGSPGGMAEPRSSVESEKRGGLSALDTVRTSPPGAGNKGNPLLSSGDCAVAAFRNRASAALESQLAAGSPSVGAT